MRGFSSLLGATLVAVVATAACGGGGQSDTTCVLGTEDCGCRDGNTCDDGLVCNGRLCVTDEAAAVGGAGSEMGGAAGSGPDAGGTGGDPTAGGTGGDPGAGGTGGSPGAGGSIAPGSGGSDVGVGGAVIIPSGGSPGAGGSPVVGGAPPVGLGGAVGTGGAEIVIPPVDPQPNTVPAKIDLLFVIDNSISMADKQALLQSAVPQLLNRLIDPPCVDSATGAVVSSSSAAGCAAGSEPEFAAVQDIHVGVTTSSLGGHGGTLCSLEHGVQYWNETQNDRGRLIYRSGTGTTVSTWNDAGFLAWDPGAAAHDPPGEADGTVLSGSFRDLVAGAGEQGCGYEATLEAWYRFLIDPDPPLDIVYDSNAYQSVGVGTDEVLLQQRALFLRPDSLVAVVMLTDENDCSVMDRSIGYLVGNPDEGAMPRSTSACDTNPNDPCCLSCIQANWPDGCSDPQTDAKCQAGLYHGDVDRSGDRLNLRCYDQKRRFGLDFLYATSRYVTGLSNATVTTRDGTTVTNPLYAASSIYPNQTPRTDASRIFLMGIVGVPWQDVATEASLSDPVALEYLSASEIAAQGLWDHIVGEPEASPPVPPTDPFMLESSEPRTGTNPRTGIAITPVQTEPGGNAINGHEYTLLAPSDLQYACIFPLETPRDCVDVEPGRGCDCKISNEVFDRPLCDGTIQQYAKAYPGGRILQVLQGYGENAVVASICPKNPTCTDAADVNCGYNPAMSALLDRMLPALQGP